jgi:hypothetical protein
MIKPSIDADGVAQTEADHFGNCPVYGALIDMRDLGQMLAHVHDAEIEINAGPEPPSARSRPTASRNKTASALRTAEAVPL